MLITGYHAESGRLTVRLEGAWVDAFKNFSGRDIEVSVATMRDHALAFCFIPSLLFPIE
jgi:D-aminopeptidase